MDNEPQPPTSKLPMWGRRTLWGVSMAACLITIGLAVFSQDVVDDVTTGGAAFVAVTLLFSLPKLRY